MTHIWLRTEERPDEYRTPLTPAGAEALLEAGFALTIEDSAHRIIPTSAYAHLGANIASEGSWRAAPEDALILGLKELPDDGTVLPHRHIMFGHAYKGQPGGQRLLDQFKAGGGTLYDLEYLLDEDGRRVAAFGYWAGYAGAAVALKAWSAQRRIEPPAALSSYASAKALLSELQADLSGNLVQPSALIIGALGRVGQGARDLCAEIGIAATLWDQAETAKGGPFPQVLAHEILLNCVLARPGTPIFAPPLILNAPRNLCVIGDIACDPGSDYNPIPLYGAATTWAAPTIRVADTPPLDITAIDNLPSLLPLDASEEFAAQLLPSLLRLGDLTQEPWTHAAAIFAEQVGR